MKLPPIFPVICFGVLMASFISCKKSSSHLNPNTTAYHIKLVSGGGQSDTVGNGLVKPLFFSLYVNGNPPTSGYVNFQTMDCDGNVQSQQYNLSQYSTPQDSLIIYQWLLNATIGVQTLKVYFLDSVQAVRDSVVVTATGLAPGPGWHITGCIIPDNGVEFGSLAELPSGRVLGALLNKSDYPYYSDDYGVSWHRLKTFPGVQTIYKLVTTAQNEVLAGVANVGVFYSNDGGQTWVTRDTGLPVSSYYGDLQYTPSGQLLTFTGVGTYYSMDKGQHWALANGLLISGFNGACSQPDGILFGINGGAVYRSDDSGQNWRDIYTADNYGSSLMLADSTGNLYIGGSAGIYSSKDTGQSWTHVYPVVSGQYADNSVYYLTKVNGTYYFYFSGNYILTQSTDFVNFSTIQPPVPIPGAGAGRVSTRYIVTPNGHYILSTDQYGVFYYNP